MYTEARSIRELCALSPRICSETRLCAAVGPGGKRRSAAGEGALNNLYALPCAVRIIVQITVQDSHLQGD